MEPIYSFLEDFLPELEAPVIVEIGANDGRDAEWILKRLRDPMKYYAFEPDDRNWEKLVNRVGEHRGVTLLKYAVSDRAGYFDFYQSHGRRLLDGDEHTDSSSLKEPLEIRPRYPWMNFTKTTVRTITLDDFRRLLRVPRVDLVWMDIQGAELDAIVGGKKFFKGVRLLYSECYQRGELYRGQPREADLLAALNADEPGRWRPIIRTPTDVLFASSEEFQSRL